jgi:hypothetical protein
MKSIKIKTLFQGQAAIRDKYQYQAYKEGINLTYKDETMVIPAGEFFNRVLARSDKPVTDRFSNESHYLLYLEWKPDIAQLSLTESMAIS